MNVDKEMHELVLKLIENNNVMINIVDRILTRLEPQSKIAEGEKGVTIVK